MTQPVDQVHFLLIDFNPQHTDEYQNLLRNKFSFQAKGKFKWLKNKKKNYKFIPIEFALDKEYICEHVNIIFDNFCFNQISGIAEDPDVLLALAGGGKDIPNLARIVLQEEKQTLLRFLTKYDLLAVLKYPFLWDSARKLIEEDCNKEVVQFLKELLKFKKEMENPEQIFKIMEDNALVNITTPFLRFKKYRKVMLAHACKFGLSMMHSEFFKDVDFLLEVFEKHKDNQEVIRCLTDLNPGPELTLRMIRISASLFDCAPFSLMKNSFLLQAVRVNPESISHAAESLRKDLKLINKAIDISPLVLNYIDLNPKVLELLEKKVQENVKESALPLMTFKPSLLKYLDFKQLSDRKFIWEFLDMVEIFNQNKRESLDFSIFNEYLIHDMRDDEELLLKFISINHETLWFASNKLRFDKTFLMKSLRVNKKSYHIIESIALTLQDFELIVDCLKFSVSIFKSTSQELKDVELIVSTAVSIHPPYLQLASDRLRNDRQFLLDLHSKSPVGINPYYCADKLCRDRDFIMELIKIGGVSDWVETIFMSETDGNFMLEVFKELDKGEKGFDLKISDELSRNRDFAFKAVKLGANYKCFDRSVRRDEELLLEYVKYQGFCVFFERELFNLRIEHQYYGCKL